VLGVLMVAEMEALLQAAAAAQQIFELVETA
jgi:hypothetical protein